MSNTITLSRSKVAKAILTTDKVEKQIHDEDVPPTEESEVETEQVIDEFVADEIPPEVDESTSDDETTIVTIKKKKKKKKKKRIIEQIEEPEEFDEVVEEDSHEVEPISDDEKEEVDESNIKNEIKKLGIIYEGIGR